MNILFISSTRVGDAVLSTGILDHLIRNHPDALITVACGPAAAPLFDAVPGLERLIVLDKMVFSLHWLGLWTACAGRRWDVLVDLRNAPIAWLLMTKRRHRFVRRQTGEHRVRQLATVLDQGSAPPAPVLWLGDDHRRAAGEMIPDGPPVLAIAPTANWRAKIWPAERFAELARRMTAGDGVLPGGRIAVFGGADERPLVMGVLDAIPADQCIDLVGRPDLLTVSACLGRCALYVGNDSGLMHVAAASGVPTLGLFGPSPESVYAPWGPLTAFVRTEKSYAEIFPPAFDHRNSGTLMEGLSVDAAEEAARTLWSRTLETAV